MSTLAPQLSELLDALLAADHRVNYQREWRAKQQQAKKAASATPKKAHAGDGDIEMRDIGDHSGGTTLQDGWTPVGDDEDEPEDADDQAQQRQNTLCNIVRDNDSHFIQTFGLRQ